MKTSRKRCHAVYNKLAMWLGLLMVGLIPLTGCAPLGAAAPTPTVVSYACVITGACRVVIPPCASAVTAPQSNNNGIWPKGVWYSGFGMPKNTAAIVGFQPLLPTEVPRGAGWYKMILLQRQSVPGAHPLLHAGYGFSPPQTFDPPDKFDGSIISLDEAAGTLDPLDNLGQFGFTFVVTSQTSATIVDLPATIYRVSVAYANVSGSSDEQVTVLMWKAGSVTLRLTVVVAGGIEELASDPSHTPIDRMVAWHGYAGDIETGARDNVLLHMAASVQPYTGCAH